MLPPIDGQSSAVIYPIEDHSQDAYTQSGYSQQACQKGHVSQPSFKPVSFNFDCLEQQPSPSEERARYIERISRKALAKVTQAG